MKVILNYGKYFNYGKQYQAKFVYENIEEAKKIKSWIKNNKLLESHQELTSLSTNKSNKTESPANIISQTSIPKDILLEFISELITLYQATILINDKEFNSIDFPNIINAINNLHLNINLKKGNYFGIKNTYYVTFKYSSDEQKEEVSYDFNMNLSPLIGKNADNESYIYPFIIDKNGKLTTENTGIIGGTNIPTPTLLFFIKRFIDEYNAIINVDDSLQQDKADVKFIQDSISHNTLVKTKIKSH